MISVIVPVFNTDQYLERVIQALLTQDFQSAKRELIFIDNGSTDGSLDILQSLQQDSEGFHVYSEPERGSYAARNMGISHARGDILAFTDSDCYPDKQWLSVIEDALSEECADIVMGARLPATDSSSLSLVSEYENAKAELIMGSKDPSVYFGYTNNMAVRSKVMDRIGPFDQRARGADTIFIRRVVEALGCKSVRYCEEMIVRHAEMDSIKTYYGKITTYGHSRKSYRHIIAVRPLNKQERLAAYLKIARKRNPWQAVKLFVLLLGGAVAWWKGGVNVAESDL